MYDILYHDIRPFTYRFPFTEIRAFLLYKQIALSNAFAYIGSNKKNSDWKKSAYVMRKITLKNLIHWTYNL